MHEDFIQLPNLEEIKTDLTQARQDVDSLVENDSNLTALGAFLNEIISIIENKASNIKNIDTLEMKDKIDLAAHFTLLNSLMDELFLSDMDEEEFDSEEEEEEEGQ